MAGKNLMPRIYARVVALVLASLLCSCAGGADRDLVAMEPQTRAGNFYAGFPYQGVKAILDAAHSAAIEKPDFGSVKQSLGNNVPPVSEITVAFDSTTFESVVTIARTNSSQLVFDTSEDISDIVINPSASLSGREGKDELVRYETDTEIALARVVTMWDPDNLGEWVSGGYWLYGSLEADTARLSGAEAGAFIDGPELSGRPSLPASGNATYKGFGAGYYTAEVGSSGAFEEGTLVMGEYWGSLVLTAAFGAEAMNIHGHVDDISINGYAHTPSGDGVAFSQQPINGRMRLNPATFSPDGQAIGSVSIVGNNVVRSDGIWGVELSSVPDDVGNPRAAAGTSSAIYTTDGGSEIVLMGVIYGVSGPPAAPPASMQR